MSSFYELKQACYEANMQLPPPGLNIFTFGNVSKIDREKVVVAIKLSGILYEQLTPESIVVIDMDLTPSSDTPTHIHLYKTGGIVFTHATYSVAWALAQKDIPIMETTHADLFRVDVPCTSPMRDEWIEPKIANIIFYYGVKLPQNSSLHSLTSAHPGDAMLRLRKWPLDSIECA